MARSKFKRWNSGSKNSSGCGGPFGGGYFLGFIGAATYYIQTTAGFWNGVLGVLKAIVWPAFLVYKLFGL